MKAAWKAWWERLSGRINALSLRERVFLFLSVIACCLALADVFWLSPAQLAHKQLTQRFEKQSVELQRARLELKALARPVDVSQATRDQMVLVKKQIESVNQTIKETLPDAARATPLAQALTHLLRRHAGLTLLRTSALALEAGTAQTTVASGSAGSAATLPAGLTRQGMELTVSGSYADLTQYVQTLENEMPQVRWGAMKLKSDKLPAELTMQLFLLGVQ